MIVTGMPTKIGLLCKVCSLPIPRCSTRDLPMKKFFDAVPRKEEIPPSRTIRTTHLSATHADASHLARALLDGLIYGIADRGNRSPADKIARARDLWAVIAACEPQDAIQTMLIGQALMFNELIADGGKDVLAGMMDTLKLRAQSNVNGMSRSLHQHVGTFLRLRDKSDAAAATNAAVIETMEAAKLTLDSAKRPPAPKAEAPRRDASVPPAETVQPVAMDVSARAEAYGRLNGTHTSVFALNAVMDPRHAKLLINGLAEPLPARASSRTPLRKSPTTHRSGNNCDWAHRPGHAAGEPSAEYSATWTSRIRGSGTTVSVTVSGAVDTLSVAWHSRARSVVK